MSLWTAPSLIDHAGDKRDDDQVRQTWSDPKARLITVNTHGEFARQGAFDAPISGEWDDGVALVGYAQDRPWFCRVGEVTDPISLREARLDDLQRELATVSVAIQNWLIATRYCERCAARLMRRAGGFAATCPNCGRETFPRHDPAVICAVIDESDRLFLAHAMAWAPDRVSILAGFVEAGESIEQALHRELHEETKLTLTTIRYVGSQPWPFPRSLMFGHVARGHGGGQVDGVELDWGRWFSVEELTAALNTHQLSIPQPDSIAGRLIRAWLEGTLPAPEG